MLRNLFVKEVGSSGQKKIRKKEGKKNSSTRSHQKLQHNILDLIFLKIMHIGYEQEGYVNIDRFLFKSASYSQDI